MLIFNRYKILFSTSEYLPRFRIAKRRKRSEDSKSRYYDNSAFFRYKNNTNIFDTSKRKKNQFTWIYGNMKLNLYNSPLTNGKQIYSYQIICLASYFCKLKDKEIISKNAIVTYAEFEIKTYGRTVNIFEFVFYGIPLEDGEEPSTVLKKQGL